MDINKPTCLNYQIDSFKGYYTSNHMYKSILTFLSSFKPVSTTYRAQLETLNRPKRSKFETCSPGQLCISHYKNCSNHRLHLVLNMQVLWALHSLRSCCDIILLSFTAAYLTQMRSQAKKYATLKSKVQTSMLKRILVKLQVLHICPYNYSLGKLTPSYGHGFYDTERRLWCLKMNQETCHLVFENASFFGPPLYRRHPGSAAPPLS